MVYWGDKLGSRTVAGEGRPPLEDGEATSILTAPLLWRRLDHLQLMAALGEGRFPSTPSSVLNPFAQLRRSLKPEASSQFTQQGTHNHN